MKSNKKFLHFIAALWILMFHICIPVTNSEIEQFIIKIGYIGVDIFFFTSAYSLVGKSIDYISLLKNRFVTIYVKFVILAIIATIYKGWKFIRLIKILIFVELFEKGGGAFLWFVPAIMIFYVLYPLFIKWNNKYKGLIIVVAWFLLSWLCATFVGYTDVFIFTNRIPVILVGYLWGKKAFPKWLSYSCLPIGIILEFLFGYKLKLNVPFKDFYFVLGIFVVVGMAVISKNIKPHKVWNVLGAGTLEMYGLSMIFGTKVVNWFYKVITSAGLNGTIGIIITDVAMVVAFTAVAILVAEIFNYCRLFIVSKFIKE